MQVVGFGAVVDADPVADPQAGQGPHRPGGGQQPHPLVDDRAEHAELLVQLPTRDRLDHGLDEIDRGWGRAGRGCGRRARRDMTSRVYAAPGPGGAGSGPSGGSQG